MILELDQNLLENFESGTFLPSNILHDFCLKSDNKPPSFQHFGCKGALHSPMFAFRVSAAGIEATASRNSKKKAKHAAAHTILLKLLKQADNYLDKNNINNDQKSDALKKAYLFLKSKENLIKSYDLVLNKEIEKLDINDENPIGKLQEICMKNKWNPPEYNEINEAGLPHEKLFTMECYIQINGEILIETGEGKSKKIAKRLSAMQMLHLLEKKNLYNPKEVIFQNQETPIFNKSSKLKVMNEGNNMFSNYIYAKSNIDNFFNSFDNELNKELDKIIVLNNDSSLIINYCQILEEVSNYIECKIDYVCFAPVDGEEIYSCLVNLLYSLSYRECPPIITGWGRSNISALESRNNAAKTALRLFNELRKKN